jgi:hypothetical protein
LCGISLCCGHSDKAPLKVNVVPELALDLGCAQSSERAEQQEWEQPLRVRRSPVPAVREIGRIDLRSREQFGQLVGSENLD